MILAKFSSLCAGMACSALLISSDAAFAQAEAPSMPMGGKHSGMQGHDKMMPGTMQDNMKGGMARSSYMSKAGMQQMGMSQKKMAQMGNRCRAEKKRGMGPAGAKPKADPMTSAPMKDMKEGCGCGSGRKDEPHLQAMKALPGILALLALLAPIPMRAQTTASEHESQHPGASPPTGPLQPKEPAKVACPQAPAIVPPAAGMEEMMKGMMSPSPGAGEVAAGCRGLAGSRPFYPTMLNLPVFTNEQRQALTNEAIKRLASGNAAMTAGYQNLNRFTLGERSHGGAGDVRRNARWAVARAEWYQRFAGPRPEAATATHRANLVQARDDHHTRH